MGSWTESGLLQALGWATLNSFWQMGILWTVFTVGNRLFAFSAMFKYRLAITSLIIGFLWFVLSLLVYNHPVASVEGARFGIGHTGWQTVSLCASIAYLALLIFPTINLLRNWRFVQTIRRQDGKAAWQHRLFVKTVAAQLGIRQKVKLVTSNLVTSPLTVGYLKPMILLPIAALNGLSVSQIEAILLHELSHIRRGDYIFNLLVSFIQTALYFNPFVKAFATVINNERETCCDDTVLQFGYNPIDYASALLHLQQTANRPATLALAAAGKGQLLSRIEKITGMEKKKPFRLIQALPLLLASLCIIAFNSILIIEDARKGQLTIYSGETVLHPWQLDGLQHAVKVPSSLPAFVPARADVALVTPSNSQLSIDIFNIAPTEEPLQRSDKLHPMEAATEAMPVAFNDVDANLTAEQKADISQTVKNAKKALTDLQWKEMETSIADAMNSREKLLARQEYLQEVNEVNWHAFEQNLKANYEKLNWQAVQESVNEALAQVKMDSVHQVYQLALVELQGLQRQLNNNAKTRVKVSPMPDASRQSLKLATETLRRNIDSLDAVRQPKKIIEL